ncbi:hypothetical protein [Methylobacterium sp. SyP6R]|uniref:hypothetical protein n=1 Tax=Methylobacterium sp. SyP6R TaxID=2718876 RepID=UPI001F201B79|nr:hypothetical protein [Methylobacterium sp. SyP6R]MCF4130078.1 hypothetical protein [Methylobacterium sp. SyP6R]
MQLHPEEPGEPELTPRELTNDLRITLITFVSQLSPDAKAKLNAFLYIASSKPVLDVDLVIDPDGLATLTLRHSVASAP